MLLNTENPSNPQMLTRLPHKDPIQQKDMVPTLQEVELTVSNLKKLKAPGTDGIPAEVWKHGDPTIIKRLHKLIFKIWEPKEVQQQ